MKKYSFEDLNEHIQPLMKILQTEYPNGFELVISADYAEIRCIMTEMNFLSDRSKLEDSSSVTMDNVISNLNRMFSRLREVNIEKKE